MKLYKDVTRDEVISVTDEGYGFPLPSFLVDMGLMMSNDVHKRCVEGAVQDFTTGVDTALTVYSGDKLTDILKTCEFMEEI